MSSSSMTDANTTTTGSSTNATSTAQTSSTSDNTTKTVVAPKKPPRPSPPPQRKRRQSPVKRKVAHGIAEKFNIYKVPIERVQGIPANDSAGQKCTPPSFSFPYLPATATATTTANIPYVSPNQKTTTMLYYATPYQTLQHYYYSQHANIASQQFGNMSVQSPPPPPPPPVSPPNVYPFPQMNPNYYSNHYYNQNNNNNNNNQNNRNVVTQANVEARSPGKKSKFSSSSSLSCSPYQSSFHSNDLIAQRLSKMQEDISKMKQMLMRDFDNTAAASQRIRMRSDNMITSPHRRNPNYQQQSQSQSQREAIDFNRFDQLVTQFNQLCNSLYGAAVQTHQAESTPKVDQDSAAMLEEADEIYKRAQQLAARMHNRMLSSLALTE